MHDNGQSTPLTAPARERYARLEQLPLRVVAPTSSFIAGSRSSILDIWHHRELWWLLTKREIKARYKDSVGGFLWTLARPLVMLFIYYFVIGRVLGAARSIDDFAVYIFAGLTAWTLFSTVISSSTSSIIANSGIVKKIYVPREIFPFSAAGSAFVDFLAQFVILVCAAFLIRGINWMNFFFYVPISILMLLVWGLALGLFLAAVNVYLRDTQYLVEVILAIGLWITPSLYSYAMVIDMAPKWFAYVYLANPTAIGVFGIQRGTWIAGDVNGVWPEHLMTRILIMLVIGLVLLFVNQRIFSRLQRNFAQEI